MVSLALHVISLCFDQGVNNQPQAQGGGGVKYPPAPGGAAFFVFIGLVIGEAEQNDGRYQKNPAIPVEPHGHGKTSQAETGQEQGKLSAHGIGKGCGHRTAACEFFFHCPFLNC